MYGGTVGIDCLDTGTWPHLSPRKPLEADFSHVTGRIEVPACPRHSGTHTPTPTHPLSPARAHSCTLHINDLDPNSASAGGWLEDTSKVEKYVMSDEEYNKRENTYRKYKEGKLKEDPEWTLEKELAKRRGVSVSIVLGRG
jgi:hypothetical protein